MAFALGDAMDELPGQAIDDAANDPLLQQLHQLALVILQLRGEVNQQLNAAANADDASFDPALLTALTQELAQYVTNFRQVAAQRTAQNPYALGTVDQAILDIGTWAQSVLAILPSTLSAIPNALLDALGKIAKKGGENLAGALVWPAVIAIGALVLLTQAEKTRTYRRAVA